MIQHTVAFRLGENANESAFWEGVATLKTIAGVHNFQILRQVGLKSDYTNALSMYFESQGDYDSYDAHPTHVAFVQNLWIPSVADFIELDYVES